MEKAKFAFNWVRGVGRDAVAKYPETAFWLILGFATLAVINGL